MIRSFIWLVFGLLMMSGPVDAADLGAPRLEIVAQLKQRPGNIAVAPDGRMFITIHPFDNPTFKVMELMSDGTTKPYPSEDWAREPAMDGTGLVNPLHLVVSAGMLYVLDMGNARTEPKLVAWDLSTNKLNRVWYLPRHVVTPQSFMQDFVMTPDGAHVFIADMGQADLIGKADPALVHLDLITGMARRLLAGDPFLRPGTKAMQAMGRQMMFSRDGKEYDLYLGFNPITLDPSGTWLYVAPMGEGDVARIKVADLLDPQLSAPDLSKRLVRIGLKPPSDGMLVDDQENIFIASVNDGAIGVLNNKGKYATWLRDPLLLWPDGLAFGPDHGIYVTVNQLHLAPAFNKGEERATPPYMVVRIMGGRPMPKDDHKAAE